MGIKEGQHRILTPYVGMAFGLTVITTVQMAHVCQRSARFGPWLYIRNGSYHASGQMLESYIRRLETTGREQGAKK